jgi:hypothetical protein
MEYEAVVVKLSSSEALRVLHELERFNPLTYRGETRAFVGEAAHTPKPVAIKAAATANRRVVAVTKCSILSHL